MYEIIIDYENLIFITRTPFQTGTEYILDTPDKLKHGNFFDILTPEQYMSLCKASIIGYDFDNDAIHVYKPILFADTNGSMYPEHLLQRTMSYEISGFSKKKNEFLALIGYGEIDIADDIAMIENILNKKESPV